MNQSKDASLGQCMFCRNAFYESSEEHVVLNALGGKLSRKRMVCRACNLRLGARLDKAFAGALEWITTLIDPKNRRTKAPAQPNIVTAEGDIVRIEPGGRIRVQRRQVSDAKWVSDADDLASFRASLERAASARKARTGEETNVVISPESIVNPTIKFQIVMEGHVAFRSAVKAALESLSVVCENGRFVDDASLDDLRAYVLDDAPAGCNDCVGYLIEPQLPELLDELHHSVLLVQREGGSTYFEVSTYGGIVSVAGVLPAISARFGSWLYCVDPVAGIHSTSHPRLVSPVSVNWTRDPGESSGERTKAALFRIASLWQARGNERTIASFIDRALEGLWPRGTVLTESMALAISHRLASDFMAFRNATAPPV